MKRIAEAMGWSELRVLKALQGKKPADRARVIRFLERRFFNDSTNPITT